VVNIALAYALIRGAGLPQIGVAGAGIAMAAGAGRSWASRRGVPSLV
jgi:Na+-driven multidrug efflux pump